MVQIRPVACIGLWALSGFSTTLERLTLDQMTTQSNEIVRGRVTAVSAAPQGSVVYTRVSIQVIERWKGAAAAQVEILVPGGTANGFRQTFSGAPQLAAGSEHVFFLWRGKSGVAQIIGLSQGLMDVQLDPAGKAVVSRNAIREPMVDSNNQPVPDTGVNMPLFALREFVKRRLEVAEK